MSAPRVPHLPGGLSSASEVGLTTAITSDAARVRPVGERIDVFEHAEEIRLLDDQRRDVLAFVRRKRRQIGMAAGAHVRDASSSSPWPPVDGLGHARDSAGAPCVGTRMRADVDLRLRAHGHQAGFGDRRGAVVHRGVGHLACRSAR